MDAGGQSNNKSNNKKKPNYNGKYTTTDSGQYEWVGLTDEGLQFFQKNRHELVLKEGGETMALERTCLVRLKAK